MTFTSIITGCIFQVLEIQHVVEVIAGIFIQLFWQGSEWVEPVQGWGSKGGGGSYSPPPLEQLINTPTPATPTSAQDDALSLTNTNTEVVGREVARLESKVK